MTNDKSLSVSGSMAILERVAKLEDPEGYLEWRRDVRDRLKMLELWTYIEDQATEPLGVTESKIAIWKAGHDKTCTALRLVVNGNAYSDIEDLTNASEAWTLLETNFKPRGSGFLNDAFQRLLGLTLADCKSPADYVSQFRNVVNELRNFSTKIKLDENFLIFFFQTNLGSDHASYFETYAQEHEPFNDSGEAKYTLSLAMHHFQNTVRNPKSKTSTDKMGIALIAAHAPAHQHTTQDGVQAGTPNSRVLTLQKTVKYCTHCHRDYHTENECRIKYPNLAPISKSGNGNRKRRRSQEGNKGSEDSKNGSYFAEGDLVTFMAVQSTSSSIFENAWVWDCGCSQHVTSDRSAFVELRKLSGQKPVKRLAGSLILIGVGTVRLWCVGTNGPKTLQLRNVLYIPDANVSLISQGQIHRQGHRLHIIPDGISLGDSGIVARLVSNNLYLVYLDSVANAKVAAGGGYGFSILMRLACTMASPAIWGMGAEYHAACRGHGTPTVSYGLYQPSPTSSVFFLIVIINTLVLPLFRVCSHARTRPRLVTCNRQNFSFHSFYRSCSDCHQW